MAALEDAVVLAAGGVRFDGAGLVRDSGFAVVCFAVVVVFLNMSIPFCLLKSVGVQIRCTFSARLGRIRLRQRLLVPCGNEANFPAATLP